MIKNILKKFAIVALELSVIAGVFWYIAQKKGYKNIDQLVPAVQQAVTGENQVPFPELAGPTQKNYTWEYKGTKYSLSQTLYKSVFDYYAALPKEYSYFGSQPTDWEEQYYGMFLKVNASDHAIDNLVEDITLQGKKHKLSDDQIAELTLAFVQSIPYDDAKAKQILAGDNQAEMEYPYQTLFANAGVCSDKSFLATVLLRSLGYGTALFTYDQQNHMSIGLQCPKEYSTYGSGYCYAETTAVGNKIGIIPSLDPSSNRATAVLAIDFSAAQQVATKQLGEVKIFQKSTGKSYGAIAGTLAVQKEIENLQKEIKNLAADLASKKNALSADEKSLKDMREDLEKLKNSGDYEKYNALAEKFNSKLKAYQKEVDSYNKAVSLYNQQVKRYNGLLQS